MGNGCAATVMTHEQKAFPKRFKRFYILHAWWNFQHMTMAGSMFVARIPRRRLALVERGTLCFI